MGNRKVWFITRPERDPHFHIDAVRAFKIATTDFTFELDISKEEGRPNMTFYKLDDEQYYMDFSATM